jgi:8-oxo-dGTP pyrophosphatase MutT (NUDIX family)
MSITYGGISIRAPLLCHSIETIFIRGRSRCRLICYTDRMDSLSTHGIVAIIKNSDGKFLLLEDAREQMKGRWAPPHGRCEDSDITEENGVIREVKEETNLNVTPIRAVLTQPADTKVKTVSFWLVETGDRDVRIDEESSAFGWYTPKEALELMLYPGTKIFFEKVMRGEIELT